MSTLMEKVDMAEVMDLARQIVAQKAARIKKAQEAQEAQALILPPPAVEYEDPDVSTKRKREEQDDFQSGTFPRW